MKFLELEQGKVVNVESIGIFHVKDTETGSPAIYIKMILEDNWHKLLDPSHKFMIGGENFVRITDMALCQLILRFIIEYLMEVPDNTYVSQVELKKIVQDFLQKAKNTRDNSQNRKLEKGNRDE